MEEHLQRYLFCSKQRRVPILLLNESVYSNKYPVKVEILVYSKCWRVYSGGVDIPVIKKQLKVVVNTPALTLREMVRVGSSETPPPRPGIVK